MDKTRPYYEIHPSKVDVVHNGIVDTDLDPVVSSDDSGRVVQDISVPTADVHNEHGPSGADYGDRSGTSPVQRNNPTIGVDEMSDANNTPMYDVLGIDVGFGDVKNIGISAGQIVIRNKYPSAIAPIVDSETFNDTRSIKMGEKSYYVGELALTQPSETIQDVTEYAHLEAFLPLFLHKTLRDMNCHPGNYPKVVVLGLSIAHIENSGYFKAKAEEYFGSLGWEVQVFVLPQGTGVKLAIDKYFVDYPRTLNAAKAQGNTYVIADIGMGTIDLLYVADGVVSPSQVRGIERRGAMVMCAKIAAHVKEAYNRTLTLKEAKSVLDSGYYELRGNRFNLVDEIEAIKREYLKLIESLIESEYGSVLDKAKFVALAGGGAYFFTKTVEEDKFFFAAKEFSEYYNAIGFAEYGARKLKA